MNIVTERLALRPWRETDAEDLYRYASDERVGPPAGWPAHKSVEESREIIRTVFSRDSVYAVTLKGAGRAVGCIGLLAGAQYNFPLAPDEGELSYWLGVPFWGRGLIPEAARAAAPRFPRNGPQGRLVRLFRRQREVETGAGEMRIPLPPH